MACEICGRNSCTRSFHSLEEQTQHDESAENVKKHVRNELLSRLNKLKDYWDEEQNISTVSFSDVEEMINDVLW